MPLCPALLPPADQTVPPIVTLVVVCMYVLSADGTQKNTQKNRPLFLLFPIRGNRPSSRPRPLRVQGEVLCDHDLPRRAVSAAGAQTNKIRKRTGPSDPCASEEIVRGNPLQERSNNKIRQIALLLVLLVRVRNLPSSALAWPTTFSAGYSDRWCVLFCGSFIYPFFKQLFVVCILFCVGKLKNNNPYLPTRGIHQQSSMGGTKDEG